MAGVKEEVALVQGKLNTPLISTQRDGVRRLLSDLTSDTPLTSKENEKDPADNVFYQLLTSSFSHPSLAVSEASLRGVIII